MKKKNLSNKKISLSKVKNKINEGGLLDASEFDVLLDHGVLDSIKSNKVKKVILKLKEIKKGR